MKSHLPSKKNEKTQMSCFPLVLSTFRSQFSESVSNWKGNRRSNRRSHVVVAGKVAVWIESGGQMMTFWEKNHLFKNRVDFVKR